MLKNYDGNHVEEVTLSVGNIWCKARGDILIKELDMQQHSHKLMSLSNTK